MKRNRLCLAAVVAALAALPFAASAAEGAEMAMFEQLDTNKDGAIDMDEAVRSAQVTADFREIDADGDGRISREEWRNYVGATGTQSATPGGSPESGARSGGGSY